MYKKQKTPFEWNKARAEKMKVYDCFSCPFLTERCNPLKPCRNEKMKKDEKELDNW